MKSSLGKVVTMLCIVLATGSGILLLVLVKSFYMSELTILMITTSCKTISFALTSFATETWMFYLNCPLEIVNGLGSSCFFALIMRVSNPKDTRKMICLTMIYWTIFESAGTLLTTTMALKLYAILPLLPFITLSCVTLVIFGCMLWLTVNMKSFKHQTLLDNVRLSESNDSVLEIDAEQWLVDAYENDSTSTTVEEIEDTPSKDSTAVSPLT